MGILARLDESEGFASGAASTSTTNTVNVVFVSSRLVVIDNMGNIGDVEAASRYIGSNQYSGAVIFEAAKGFLALRLRFVAVDSDRAEAFFAELLGETLNSKFGLAKEEDLFEFAVLEHMEEFLHLFFFGAGFDDVLIYGFAGINYAYGYRGRVGQEFFGDLLDARGHGSAKEKGLSIGGDLLDYGANIANKTHIEHAVGFV